METMTAVRYELEPELDHHGALMRVKELEEQLRSTRVSTICSLAQLLDLKHLAAGGQDARLAEWAVRIAREMGMNEEQAYAVEVAALLHDVGKLGIPDAVLRKNGPYDADDWAIMHRHPEYGWNILRLLPDLEQAAWFVLHHHERIDGNGYPGGLRGSEIPLGARIIAVVDAFDGMIASRTYQDALSIEEAVRRLVLASGTQFDGDVVAHFIRIVEAEADDFARARLDRTSLEAPAVFPLCELSLASSARSARSGHSGRSERTRATVPARYFSS